MTSFCSRLSLYLLHWSVMPALRLPEIPPNILKLPKDGVSTSKIGAIFSFSGSDALLKLSLVHAPLYLAGQKKYVEPRSGPSNFPFRIERHDGVIIVFEMLPVNEDLRRPEKKNRASTGIASRPTFALLPHLWIIRNLIN